MSNFSGNVDVVREREAERQARLQLLDGIREPSPQPIFGEPMRVDPSADDETSRRIKDTLGDFNHVQHYLINDPKHLIGISRSAPSVPRDEHGSGLWGSTSRQQLSSSRPGQAPRDSSAIKKPPLINGTHKPYSSNSSSGRVDASKTSHPPLTKPSSEKKAPVKLRIDNLKNAIHGVCGTSIHVEKDKPREKSKDSNRTRDRELSSYSVPSSNPVTVNNCSNVTVNVANVSIASDAFNNCSNPLSLIVHNGSHPNGLIRDSDCDSNNKRTQAKHSLTKLSIPVQKNVESHIELKSIFQEMKEAVPPPLTAIHTPKNDGSGFSFTLENSLVPFDKQDEQTPTIHQTPPPTKKTTVASTVNLQEDLEMSDSDDDDDEPGAFKISPTPVEYLKSPSKPAMEQAPASPGGQSSSSESSCSDSEESSSTDSNDSDSSASSEASDQEAPSTPTPQTWGLTNFFDETRRNHSPAFMPLDNNTNSSTAVKEEPVQSVGSLADEDSVNYILGKYSLQSPITHLLGLNDTGGDDAKSEILSPIRSLSPPSGQPSLRGPHTPPTPPEPQEEIVNENASKKEKVKQDVQKVLQTKNESKKVSEPVSAAADVQNNKVKARVGKSKSNSHSRTSEAGENNRTDSKEHSASKISTKVSTAEAKSSAVSAITVTSTTTCPVPSVTTTTSRGSPIKSHHRHSSSVKRTKSYNELKDSDVKKEAKKSHTFPKPSSAKTVPPPKFSEADCADGKKSVSVKSESSVQSDSASKLEKDTHVRKTDDSSSVTKKNRDSRSRPSSGHDSRSSSTSSTPKVKQKSEKTKPQNEPTVKKSEKKKKPAKKFSIKDFIQSPVPPPPLSEDEVSVNSPFQKSPTPERTLSPEVRREENNEQKFSPESLPSSRTQSPGKPSSKVSEKNKHTRKHSHSSVVDVINSVARGEVFDHPKEETKRPSTEISEELSSIISDKSSETHLPVHVVAPQLLSPISVDSPAPSSKPESAISSVLISIPFEMLIRVPHTKSKHKTSNHSEDKTVPAPVKEKVPSAEKSSNRPPADKPLLSDDIKSKYRTDASEVRTSKGTPKKEKHIKESKHSQGSSNSVNKSSSSSSSKSSAKAVSSSSDSASVSKKRKSESDDNPHLKKKPKVPLKPAHTVKKEPKEPSVAVKAEPVSPIPSEPKHSPKPLERVGSASSLSSFSSQQSHKSAKSFKEKGKDKIKDEPEPKRFKSSNSSASHVKEVKREKEEKPKNREKKECLSSEKTRTSKESVAGKESDKVYKSESTWDSKENISAKDKLLKTEPVWDEFHNLSSQSGHWDVQCKSEESKMCKSEESKMMPTNHERQSVTESHKRCSSTFDWQNFTPGAEQTPKRSNKQCSSDEYYMEEAKKMKHQADKQPDAVLQAMQYLEAVLLFILTACHKEKNNKDAESIFRLYKETLHFSYFVSNTIQKLQNSCSTFGSIDYKLLILTLRCQSLLCLKLYYLRRNEVKEHQKGVNDFMKQSTSYRLSSHSSPLPASNSSFSRNMSQPSPCQPRLGTAGGVPSPHSPTPSPAGSVNSQSSGYSSSEMNSYHSRPQSSLQSSYAPAVVSVPQNVFDMMKRQHTHLNNLHNCHELWEQADMYMTRSHSKEF